MKKIILFLSVIVASGALITNIYNSIVDAPSWGYQIPDSISTARQYYEVTNPGTFYRVYSPLNQVIALITVFLFWRSSTNIRLYLIAALALYIATDVLTFGYFYPRNAIMFEADIDINAISLAWSEWSFMNWVRSLILLLGVFFSSIALHKSYLITK